MDRSTRVDVIFEEILEEVRRSQVHCECSTKNQKMKKGDTTPSTTSALPNFRRFTNASDATKEDQVICRFFRPIVPGYEIELKLPSPFCQNLSGEIPADAILISCKGMWAVELARCSCHGLLALSGNGWDSFIFNHDLKLGDLISFEQTDQMVFKTYVFDPSTMEKGLPNLRRAELNGEAGRSRKRRVKAGCCCQQDENENQFVTYIEAHHLKHNYLTITAEFLKSNDLRDKKTAILVNSSGHAWEVELATYYDPRLAETSQRNMKLRNGWSAFLKSNKLKIGDICIFELDHLSTLTSYTNIVFKVKVVRVM